MNYVNASPFAASSAISASGGFTVQDALFSGLNNPLASNYNNQEQIIHSLHGFQGQDILGDKKDDLERFNSKKFHKNLAIMSKLSYKKKLYKQDKLFALKEEARTMGYTVILNSNANDFNGYGYKAMAFIAEDHVVIARAKT